MKKFKCFIELLIVLIALGAALYTQRVDVLQWYQEVSAPTLPEAVSYEEVGEQGELEDLDDEVVVEPEILDGVEKEAGDEEIIKEVNGDEFEEVDTVVEERSLEEEIVEEFPASINLAVPFTPQAPHANWDLPYKEACEEASVYMVQAYYEGVSEGLIDADTASAKLDQIFAFENELLGFNTDTTVDQTSIFAEFMFGFTGVEIIEDPTVDDIKQQLVQGRPVIVPAAGRLLGNPYFTAPGPIYHMLVIRGYTADDQFIVNDPGTKRGEAYLYDFDTIMYAMHDWNNGEEITDGRKVVLVVYP